MNLLAMIGCALMLMVLCAGCSSGGSPTLVASLVSVNWNVKERRRIMADEETKKPIFVERTGVGNIISEDRLNELLEEGYVYAGDMRGRASMADPPEGYVYYIFYLKQ